MVNENGKNKKIYNTKQLKKKEYLCKRCGYFTLIYSNFNRHNNRKTKCKRVSQNGGGNENKPQELTLQDKKKIILKSYLDQFTNELQKLQSFIKIKYLNQKFKEYQRKLREDPQLFSNKKEITDEMHNHFDLGLEMLNSILAKNTIQSELTNDDLKIEVKRIIVHVVEKAIIVAEEKDVQNGEQKVKEKISKDYPCIDKFYKEPEIYDLRTNLNTILREKTKFIETIQEKLKNSNYDSINDDILNIKKSIEKKTKFRNMSNSKKKWNIFWKRSNDPYNEFQNNYAEYLDRDNESTIKQLLFTLERIKYFNSEDISPKVITYDYNNLTKKTPNNPQKIKTIRVECTFECRKAGYQNLGYSCEKERNDCIIKKLNKPKDPKNEVKP
jgi:hypothetical protein